MEKHGVFISYRHVDWALAGRIYDFLSEKGLRPFLDASSMCQGDFPETLDYQIRNAPYFLLVLTANTFSSMDPQDWICIEVKTALQSNRKILLVSDGPYKWPENMPEELLDIKRAHFDEVGRLSFRNVMENLCEQDIDWSLLTGILDWRQRLKSLSNVCVTDRERIERKLAPLADRFGPELVEAIQQKKHYEGENRVRFIHMSCYAASVIFSPERHMVDERAFDLGLMFNIFAWMLQDDGFSLEIVITAPDSFASMDAINNEKLGNSALEACPEAIFLSAYFNIQRLIREEPVFNRAYREHRFRFMVTDNVLPYALFQVEYKRGYEENSHIKVDLYSEGITSNMDRRCMMIFKQDDPTNYNFFVRCYEYIRNVKKSRDLIRQHSGEWQMQWEKIQEEMM